MTQEEFKRYQEQTFDSYCKRLIRNEGRNSLRAIGNRAKHEVSLSSLTPTDEYGIAYQDDYSIDNAEMVHIEQKQVGVSDRYLGQALSQLLPQHRAVVLMYYFSDMTDEAIGQKLGLTTAAIRYRRKNALDKLKQLLEDISNE